MKQKLFTLFLALVASIGTMFAWDYERILIGELYYNLDATSKTAEVTSQNNTSPFWSTSITNANIPSTVTYNSVAYSVTSIGKYALYSCADLTSVTIPNSVTSIGEWVFYECVGLTSITFPNSLASIGDYAFVNCSGLTSLEFPSSITDIGRETFSGCSGLTAMTCKAVTPPDLRRSVFYNVNKSIPLYVPAESVTAYQTTDQWEDFTNIQAISEQQSVPAVYTNQANSTQKLIHNGKVYILNDNKTYTLTGQEVK